MRVAFPFHLKNVRIHSHWWSTSDVLMKLKTVWTKLDEFVQKRCKTIKVKNLLDIRIMRSNNFWLKRLNYGFFSLITTKNVFLSKCRCGKKLFAITTRVSLVCTMYAYICTSQCIPTQHKGGDKGRFALWSFWSTKLKGDKGCLIF